MTTTTTPLVIYPIAVADAVVVERFVVVVAGETGCVLAADAGV